MFAHDGIPTSAGLSLHAQDYAARMGSELNHGPPADITRHNANSDTALNNACATIEGTIRCVL
jgi:hypothetical protein